MPELTIDQAFQLALQHHQAGRLGDAEGIYRQILARLPEHADANHLLGVVAYQTGRLREALPLVEAALALTPRAAIYHNTLGQVLAALGQPERAQTAYVTALELQPNYAEALNNLGNVLQYRERLDEAMGCYRRAIELAPDYGMPWTNLANLHKDQGQMDQAIACYRRAVELQPGSTLLHSNLLLALHYRVDLSSAALAEEHRRWRVRHADPLRPAVPAHRNPREPQRRLRIGYVSADFRDHAVARFLLPLLRHHDRAAFEIHCYVDVPNPDAVTAQFRTAADAWHDIAGVDDATVATRIAADEIDVLVDLMAHSARNRLLVFARKPAPVQATWLAYCSTTGLETIDYRISDPWFDPPGGDVAHYSEQTVRLPETYWCCAAPAVGIEPGPLPALAAGHVTFGCLNNFCKVTDATLQLWTRVLAIVPDSRLVLHASAGSHRERVRAALRSGGIAETRVVFVGRQSLAEYLATYQRIDIGLDPVPFTGGTTTCDALWMGVPVVSLVGATTVSRGGLSLLSNVGHPELVARQADDYVRIAAEFARDRPRLVALRAGLRHHLEASPVMDTPRFTRHLETAYRNMWGRYCAAPLK